MIRDSATIVGVLTLILGVVTLALDHVRRRRQATLEAYIQAGDYRRKLDEAQRSARSGHDEEPLALAEALALANPQDPHHADVRDYLNFWEHIAVGTKLGVFSHKVLRRISRRHVVKVYERYAPYIYFLRWGEEHPSAYEALERLATRFGAHVDVEALQNYWKINSPAQSAPQKM